LAACFNEDIITRRRQFAVIPKSLYRNITALSCRLSRGFNYIEAIHVILAAAINDTSSIRLRVHS